MSLDFYTLDQKHDYEVMIVDDVSDNVALLSGILYEKNIEISFAVNGIQALTAIRYNAPDLILLDISMPDMDGFEVCRQLKEDPATAHIPIIFLTARNQTEDIVRGFEMGAADFVTKPFNTTELLLRVMTQLNLKKSKDIIHSQNLKLNELNATKDKFFSIIAHDLKNPFNTMMGFSELLLNNLEQYDLEKIRRFVGILFDTSKHSYNLLENLLQWSKSQTGRIEMSPTKINLKTYIETSFMVVRSVAIKKNIALVSEVPENFEVFADTNMLSTVLRNLLSNALKFTFTDGTIRVTARELGDLIEIKVIDNGMGISTDIITKLFRIDEHYSSMGTDKEKGTGLGLILCKEFVEQNGGTISVESEEEKGSTFKFTLPKF